MGLMCYGFQQHKRTSSILRCYNTTKIHCLYIQLKYIVLSALEKTLEAESMEGECVLFDLDTAVQQPLAEERSGTTSMDLKAIAINVPPPTTQRPRRIPLGTPSRAATLSSDEERAGA
jgi:hypothetical protein